MALKLLQYLHCWSRSCLVVISKFYLLSIRLNSATNIRKHPFLYPQGESLRINFDHIYHQRSPSQVAPWCSGYHYCTTSFSQAWIQVQILFAVYRRFAMVRILTIVPAGNIAKHLSPVKCNTETIIIIKSV